MNIRKKTISSRVIAFVTAAIFVLYTFSPDFFNRDGAKAAGSAENNGVSQYPEATQIGLETSDITHRDKLVDNGNGTFTFTSEISAAFSYSDESKNRAKTQDGYRVIDKEGVYLLELWGGKGGKGSQLPLINTKPGEPGKGGFVYGTFDSKGSVGKMLYYEVGSNGKSITRNIDDGGSGGIGGGAGNITVISVGAGGGYSAIYLIDTDDLDENGVIKEEAKNDPEKVLMIAGGGGGGGAGANLIPVPKNTPDGGDGGTIGTLTAAANVEVSEGVFFNGEYYAGKDGTSSGKKTTYTGKGGTDRPGEVNKSILGFFDASSMPNDWLAKYHPEVARGSGGAGNLRGGGGGAGFAGGSGGVQLTAVDAENVGGGGGGSSYINTGKITKWTKDGNGNQAVDKYFTEDNSNNDGGSVIIRFIPTGTNSYEYLKDDVTVSGIVSEHFDIVGSSGNNFSATGNIFSATGKISPEFEDKLTLGETKNKISFSITLKPKDGFAGGNDVPIFSSDIECASNVKSDIKTTLIKEANDYKDDYSITHVNVPFNYKIKTNSIIKKVNEEYSVSELLEVVQGAYTGNDFINKIEEPEISGFRANTSVGIHPYTAKMTIVPKSGGSESVGTPNSIPTVLSANAVVQVYDEVPQELDGLLVNAKKNLSYDDGEYKLSVDVKVAPKDTLREAYVVDVVPEEEKSKDNTITYEYNNNNQLKNVNQMKFEPADYECQAGYYYFEALGGDGGKGADYNANKGGKGGKGGGVRGIIYLDSPKTFTVSVGYNGAESKSYPWTQESKNIGGYGGGSTTISIGGTIVVAAGGGSGGGKAYSPQWDSRNYDGKDGKSPDVLETDVSKIKDSGENGDSSNDGKTMEAAPNYINRDYVCFNVPDGIYLPDNLNGLKDDVDYITNATDFIYYKKDNSKANEGGAVIIKRLAVKGEYKFFDGTVGTKISDNSITDNLNLRAQNYVRNFKLTEEFSEYFTYLDSIDVSGSGLSGHDVNKLDNKIEFKLDLPYEVTDDENWKPVAGDNNIKTTRHTYKLRDSYEFNITVRLKPKEGFLGGNDVPLLKKEKKISISHSNNTIDSQDDVIELPENDATDWANVELDMSGFKFSMEDTVVDCGTVVSAADLVSVTNNPAEPASWRSDFVKFTSFITPDNNERIFTDTKFTLTAGLVPEAEAKKAQIIGSVSGKQRTAEVTAYVKCTVNFNLVNLVTDRNTDDNHHEVFMASDYRNKDYVAEITPAAGYRLPKTAVVQGLDKDSYTVENKDGRIIVTIPKGKITSNFTISASGILIPHKVHYMYQVRVQKPDGSYEIQIKNETDVRDYYKNVEVYDFTKVIDGYGNYGDPPPGYSGYEWIWPDADYVLDENGERTNERISGGKLKNSDVVVMGDEDLYVIGRFKQKFYRLVIREYEGTSLKNTKYYPTDLKDENAYIYNSYYNIVASERANYVTDTPVLSGYISDIDSIAKENKNDNRWDITIDVKYTKKQNFSSPTNQNQSIIIDFIECKSAENLDGNIRKQIVYDATSDLKNKDTYEYTYPYSTISPNNLIFDNYEIFEIHKEYFTNGSSNPKTDKNITKIEGEIKKYTYNNWGLYQSGNRDNTNAHFIVYYKPIEKIDKEVTLLFNPNEGICSPSEPRVVKVGMEYGYDPTDTTTEKYISLPKATRQDMIFDGWYTTDSNGELVRLIEEDTPVEETDIITIEGQEVIILKPKWKSSEVTITITYGYAEGVPVEDQNLRFPEKKEFQVVYNMTYEFKGEDIIPTREYPDFAPNMNVVKGVAVEDETIEVLYSNKAKLSIRIYSSEYEYEYNLSKMPVLRDASFSIYKEGDESPFIENIGNSGIINLESPKIKRGQTYIIRCTSPPPGFNRYEERFTIEDVVTEKTIFLVKSFDLPFTGTTNQVVYYCTGAGIMLLAALLLYKILKKEKQNDDN